MIEAQAMDMILCGSHFFFFLIFPVILVEYIVYYFILFILKLDRVVK